MEALVNFSQHRQDIILAHALREVNSKDIFWIDVGANDPVNCSVTLLFSMRGGHGINIEPQVLYRKRYEKLRSRDENLFVGIGEKNGELTLYGEGDTATMLKEGGVESRTTKVKVITLTDVFEKYVTESQVVHFLKIDVEGFEEQCIRGLDLFKYKPWIICVECLQHEKYKAYESIILNAGYQYTYYDGQNRYYVLGEKTEVVNRFKEMEHLDDYYEIISLSDATKYLSYEQSTSWRMTAPLRKAVSIIKKIKRQ